jgi:hypothetical protein
MCLFIQKPVMIQCTVGITVISFCLISIEEGNHDEFEFDHFKDKPFVLINEIFKKLGLYQEINKGFDQAQNSQLSNYLQSKVAKMPREYLELLFSLIFEDIENKDEVVNAIVQGQAQPNIIQNIKKTIIKPQFNIIPYNIRSIENILNRVYSIDKSDQKPETKNNIQTQTGIDIGASKQDTSTIHINTLRTLKNSSKS